ncbi:beta-N-acetylglucosaminidase domain-containing protein [Streptomyces hirsutus]
MLRELPGTLAGDPRTASLADEVAPWTGQLARYGEAGLTALDMLRAQESDDAGASWTAYRELAERRTLLKPARVTVGKGVLDPFLNRARDASQTWAGIGREATAGSGGRSDDGVLQLPRVRDLSTVTVLAEPGTVGRSRSTRRARAGAASAHRPPPAPPSCRWTDRPAPSASPARTASRALHVVPCFTDEPGVSMNVLPDGPADTDIGGTRRLTATLDSLRPEQVRGKATVEAPKGVKVRVPEGADRPARHLRGSARQADGGARGADPVVRGAARLRRGAHTLTVNAVPRTAGPDLARTGTASSSSDETPDFPASAANDGVPETRWSSPVEDDSWWQVELERPVRLGKVALHWQDASLPLGVPRRGPADGRSLAYGGVSDGQRRRAGDAAHGRTRRPSRPRPGRGPRHRVGHSLWSVEAYAVAD